MPVQTISIVYYIYTYASDFELSQGDVHKQIRINNDAIIKVYLYITYIYINISIFNSQI